VLAVPSRLQNTASLVDAHSDSARRAPGGAMLPVNLDSRTELFGPFWCKSVHRGACLSRAECGAALPVRARLQRMADHRRWRQQTYLWRMPSRCLPQMNSVACHCCPKASVRVKRTRRDAPRRVRESDRPASAFSPRWTARRAARASKRSHCTYLAARGGARTIAPSDKLSGRGGVATGTPGWEQRRRVPRDAKRWRSTPSHE
jgi:hypothetical protein